MQRTRSMSIALMAVFALSAFAVSSASASSFLSHPAGGIAGVNVGKHIFKVNGGNVECTTVAVSGNTEALKSLHQLVQVKYSNCNAFGNTAQISLALYLFSADLQVSVENDIIVTDKVGNCFVLVNQTGNQNLSFVHYANSGQDIKVNANVQNITYSSSGGACGASGVNGTYTGEAFVGSTQPGGTVRWDKE